jgi:P27 family predicted phage terminase small subunit
MKTKSSATHRALIRLVTSTPDAPDHLTATTKQWYRSVVEEYELDAHHLMLLQSAAETWDELQECRALIARDGLIIEGREGGVRAHPASAILRTARITFARLIRELDLDVAEPGHADTRYRPPALRSNRR